MFDNLFVSEVLEHIRESIGYGHHPHPYPHVTRRSCFWEMKLGELTVKFKPKLVQDSSAHDYVFR